MNTFASRVPFLGKATPQSPMGKEDSAGMNVKKQLTVLSILLIVYVLLAFATYLFLPLEQLSPNGTISPALAAIPRWQLGLANAALVLVLYSIVGLIGFWFARKLGLPGIFRERASWREWVGLPLLIGLVVGIVIVMIDRVFSAFGGAPALVHPTFPLSIIASAAAGIGEEILFRMFVLGLWAFLLNLVLRRLNATNTALWIGNFFAALAFAAGHLPTLMILFNVTSPAQIPPAILIEVVLLNGIMGLAAGERYMRSGLVAAAGVHFWADVVWHVLFPLIAL